MKQKDILQFWRNVEIFNLPDLDSKNVKLLNKDAQLPWEIQKSTKEGKKRVFTLFFGKFSKEKIVNQIEKFFPNKEENEWEEKVSGFTCFSSIILDENGQPDSQSYTLASYVLGIDVLNNKKDISSVYQCLENVSEEYKDRFNILKSSDEENPKGDIITWNFIDKEIGYLKSLSQWNDEEIKVYFSEKEVGENAQIDAPFLNSFYLDDLNKLISTEIELSSTLQSYLTIEPNQKRYDLIGNKKYLFDTINPTQLTASKWPSNPKYGLCTAQLGAVNTIFKNLANTSGIQGVNGPPGTGKTTLLLDVIAQIVVDRAKKILDIGVNNIFGEHKKVADYIHTYKLNPALEKNYGIVVASNNNSAVENISKELPQAKKINKYETKDKDGKKRPPSFPNADYFAEYAKNFTNEENWGILAAALGNSKNNSEFYKHFWKSLTKDENGKLDIDRSQVNFYNYLESNQSLQEEHQSNFETAKKEFSSLLNDFEKFKNIAIDFHNKYDEHIKNIQLKKDSERKKAQTDGELVKLSEKKETINKHLEDLKVLIGLLNSQKPVFFFFHKLFNTKSFINWNNKAEPLLSQQNDFSSQLLQTVNYLTKLEREQNDIKNKLNEINKFEKEYYSLKNILKQEYQIKDENLFDENFNAKDLKEIHLLSPYHSEKVAKLRSEIFLKALDVHKFAILANAKQFKNNLNAFFEMILGRAKVSEELKTMLWDSFFFCVPAVSTSLASASRLFPNMIQNQIGWLLIDEAGQATPQSVAGLIQRSKRCVIVGDPLQVEPVVTIPQKLVENLMQHQSVENTWSPHTTSVQQLADRISQYGTLMGNTEDKIWTGFPLRTHRRCFSPMFDIANQIAYNNQMVKGIKDEDKCDYIGSSCWFDVQGNGSGDSQVIKEEIHTLEEKIKDLREKKYEGQIYVISPFKLIANECRKFLKDYKKVQCGTIHTFQGKEADVVFIVLGSQPEKEGTRKWASAKPNMLNVALTRAKKRCYIIGNKELWNKQPYFDTMGKSLDNITHKVY